MGHLNPYLIKLIEEAIAEEELAFAAYMKMADAFGEDADKIRAIAADEMKHKKMLADLYEDLTGKMLEKTKAETVDFESKDKAEMVAESLEKEIENAKMYRTMYFAMADQRGKNVLFEIMTDEMLHGAALAAM